MEKKKIILATTSPRRHGLAQTMGLDFQVVPSNYEEDMTKAMKPKDMVIEFSYGKASDVAKNFKEGVVIGVDTIVVFNGKNLGKPKGDKQAFDMLKSFSGKKQYVYSGICIIDCKTGKTIRDCEITEVYFKKMEDNEIRSYLATGEHKDKAGGYGIQDLSSIFIKKINGCYFNVMGFPIYNIYKNLQKLGVDIFQYDRWKQKK
ncbi:MAG: Maf family protein [Candidatus Nanoarchaeia archaeon]